MLTSLTWADLMARRGPRPPEQETAMTSAHPTDQAPAPQLDPGAEIHGTE